MKPSSTTVTVAIAAFAFLGCSSEASDAGANTAPVTPCEVTGTCVPSAGGAGGAFGTGGAPPATGGFIATGGTPGTGGTLATGGSPASGGAVSSGGAAGSGGEPQSDDCDVPLEIRARRDATGAKFPVGFGTIDLYQCFAFKVDLPGKVHALSFQPLIDNPKIVHHYLLYRMAIPQADGVTSPCVGLHLDGMLVDGWAPGQEGVKLPRDVGMDIGTGDFMLEIHYNNLDESVEDASGVRVCATKNLRKNTATVSWLGTEAIVIPPATRDFKVTSRCMPNAAGPINVLRSWPHMHLLGRHMKADIVRASGNKEVLFDKKFDFNEQLGYETPAVLNPGDSIVTTCTFDNDGAFPVTFGEGTTAEMCYNFTVAYPANALQSFGLHSTSCNN